MNFRTRGVPRPKQKMSINLEIPFYGGLASLPRAQSPKKGQFTRKDRERITKIKDIQKDILTYKTDDNLSTLAEEQLKFNPFVIKERFNHHNNIMNRIKTVSENNLKLESNDSYFNAILSLSKEGKSVSNLTTLKKAQKKLQENIEYGKEGAYDDGMIFKLGLAQMGQHEPLEILKNIV